MVGSASRSWKASPITGHLAGVFEDSAATGAATVSDIRIYRDRGMADRLQFPFTRMAEGYTSEGDRWPEHDPPLFKILTFTP